MYRGWGLTSAGTLILQVICIYTYGLASEAPVNVGGKLIVAAPKEQSFGKQLGYMLETPRILNYSSYNDKIIVWK